MFFLFVAAGELKRGRPIQRSRKKLEAYYHVIR